MALIHVKTQSGFECDFDTDVLNDMRMLDDLVELDNGNTAVYPKILSKLMPKEDKERLYKFLETEDGKVPIDKFGVELTEIFKAVSTQNEKAKK